MSHRLPFINANAVLLSTQLMSSQERFKIAVNMFLSECNAAMREVVLRGVPGFDHLLRVALSEPPI